MPAQPVWFHRLEKILAELGAIQDEYLDRHAVERLFGVRERRARQLMRGLPCLQVGNAVAVARRALIERMESVANGDSLAFELARRTRVAESLEVARRQAAARRIRLPVPAEAHAAKAADLSPAIDLRPGELRIRFEGPLDLAAKLFELSQAMANDWTAFTHAVAEVAEAGRDQSGPPTP